MKQKQYRRSRSWYHRSWKPKPKQPRGVAEETQGIRRHMQGNTAKEQRPCANQKLRWVCASCAKKLAGSTVRPGQVCASQRRKQHTPLQADESKRKPEGCVRGAAWIAIGGRSKQRDVCKGVDDLVREPYESGTWTRELRMKCCLSCCSQTEQTGRVGWR